MRLPLYSLYFTIALSVVVCCLSSAEAKKKTPPSRWPVPVQCFTNTQSVFRGQTIAANYICVPFELHSYVLSGAMWSSTQLVAVHVCKELC
jgi:hypothetical protein